MTVGSSDFGPVEILQLLIDADRRSDGRMTGEFREWAALSTNVDYLEAFGKLCSATGSSLAMFTPLEQSAASILLSAALDDFRDAVPDMLGDASPGKVDAFALLCALRAIRKAYKPLPAPHEVVQIANLAFSAGRIAERMHLSKFEDDVTRGMKTLRGAKAAHAQTHGSEAEKRELWSRMLDRWLEAKAENPRMTLGAIDDLVAKEFGKGAKTMRRVRLEYVNRLRPAE